MVFTQAPSVFIAGKRSPDSSFAPSRRGKPNSPHAPAVPKGSRVPRQPLSPPRAPSRHRSCFLDTDLGAEVSRGASSTSAQPNAQLQAPCFLWALFLFVSLLWLKSAFQPSQGFDPHPTAKPEEFPLPTRHCLPLPQGCSSGSVSGIRLGDVYLPQALFPSPLAGKTSLRMISRDICPPPLARGPADEGWVYGRIGNPAKECSGK